MDVALRMLGASSAAQLLYVLALTAARLVPIFVIAPFLGGRHLPILLRVAISFAVLLLIAPPLAAGLPADAFTTLSPTAFALLLVKEAALGMLLGFLVSIPFYAARAAGSVGDAALSGSASALTDAPGSTSFADLSLLLAVVVFFGVNGHLLFLRAFAASYEAVPLLGLPSAGAVAQTGNVAIAATAELILAAIGLAAPILAAQLLADMAFAVIARGSGGLAAGHASALAPVRALVIVTTLLLTLGALALAIRGELGAAMTRVGQALDILHGGP